MATPTLTTRQARWVQEYLACGNATASAIKAGFSSRGAGVAGNRMLKNAYVQEALQARQNADATRLCLERNDVLNGLLGAINEAREQRNPAAMIRGWSEIARMLGFYQPQSLKVDLRAEEHVGRDRFQTMSDAELAELIESGRAARLSAPSV
jgi:phage terminase small subunit